jgi:hypothetical protein
MTDQSSSASLKQHYILAINLPWLSKRRTTEDFEFEEEREEEEEEEEENGELNAGAIGSPPTIPQHRPSAAAPRLLT